MGYEDLGKYHLKIDHSFLDSGDELPLVSNGWTLDEGCEYIQMFGGQVVWRHADIDDPEQLASPEDQKDVGRFRGYILRATRALNDGLDLRDHCDAHSQLLFDYSRAFYDRNGEPRAQLWEEVTPAGWDLLILDEVALHPAHRGRAVGLRVARRLIDLFGAGCGLVATIPFPLQHSDQPSDTPAFYIHPEKDFTRARQKLETYARRLGFSRVRRTRFYAASLAHVKLTEQELRSSRRSPIVIEEGWRAPSAGPLG